MKCKIVLIMCLILAVSCKKEITKNQTVETEKNSLKEQVEVSTVALEDGTKLINDWVELANFQGELKSVSDKHITSEKELEQLINYVNKLKETLPKKFDNTAIKTRIKVLETELLMYNQNVKDQDFNLASKRKINLQKAYNVFVNQIKALLIKERDYEKYK